ncbi:MAG TPA: PA14 domain-containing protein, partial [Chloroflexota bacterium]|nr:PA14 domain-containing protein [Chloroflexota bacterium]
MLRVLVTAIGIAIAVVCALLAQHPADPWQVPAWVVAASLLAIGVAAVVFPDPLASKVEKVQASLVGARSVLLPVGLLVVPTLVAVWLWSREPFTVNHAFVMGSSTWAALLWIAGMVAGLLAAWPTPFPRSWSWLRKERVLWLVLEALAILVIFDVAAGLRLYHLATLPEGVWFDEVDFANSAQLLRSMPFQPFGAFNVGHNPSLYFYVLAFLLKVGGMSIAMARLTAALFGLLAVLAVYGLGRRVGGPALGLCAAALLAIAQWAIDFSRFGMSNIAAPAMIGAGFLALAMAMYRPRIFWFALSGVLLGLSLLTYAGGFLAGACVAILVVGIRLLTDRAFRRAAWPAALFLPLGLLVGAAPFLTALGLDRSYTLDRESTVSLFTEYTAWPDRISALLHNLRLHLLMFTVAGDNNGRHNLSGAPMLDTVTGACLLLGLGICLRRLYHWFYLLLVCWLGASMLGGILSLDFEAPQGARTVGAVAPIALIAALPLALLARGVWLGLPRLAGNPASWRAQAETVAPGSRMLQGGRQQFLAVALAAVVVCVPLGVAYARNTHQYFVEQAASMISWSAMDGLQAIMGREAAALQQQGYTVRIDPSLAGDPIVQFASGGLNPPPFDAGVPVELPVPTGGLALLIPATSQNVLDYVRQSFPTVQVLPLAPAFDHTQTQAYALIVRPADVAASLGVTAQFGTAGSIEQHVQGPIAWPAGSGPRSTVTIRGTLLLTTAQAWRPVAFRVDGAPNATLSIDGQAWTGATPALLLGAGNHQVVVQAQGRAAARLTLEWNAALGPSSLLNAQGWAALPPMALAAPTLPTGGLLGLYYSGPTIGTAPALARVDQTIYAYYQTPPTGGNFPFAARWLGTVRIAQRGTYTFRLDSVGPGTLFIDGQPVVSSSGTPAIGSVALNAGKHRIELDY